MTVRGKTDQQAFGDHIQLQPSITYSCSLYYLRLQPPPPTVAASGTYGCTLSYLRLQAFGDWYFRRGGEHMLLDDRSDPSALCACSQLAGAGAAAGDGDGDRDGDGDDDSDGSAAAASDGASPKADGTVWPGGVEQARGAEGPYLPGLWGQSGPTGAAAAAADAGGADAASFVLRGLLCVPALLCLLSLLRLHCKPAGRNTPESP